MDLRYVFVGLLWFAMLYGPLAHAQNQPVSGLTPRTPPVQSTDLIPILPVGATRLQSATVAQIQTAVGGGTLTSVICGAGLNGGTITVTGTCSLADIAAQTHKFIASITSGVATLTQPTVGDLSAVAANTVLGNFTSGSAAPAANSVPSCADTGGNHLNYVSGSGITCGNSANSGSGVAPNLLKFGPPTVLGTVNGPGYFDPQPAGLIDVTDNFTATGNFTATTSGAGSVTGFTVAGNVGTVGTSGVITATYMETSDATLTAPQTFVSLKSTSITSGTSFANPEVGICKDSTHYIVALYDAINHLIQVQVNIGGTTASATLGSTTLSTPFSLGMSLVNNSAEAWYNIGGGWIFAAGESVKATLDFTGSSALTGYHSCFQIQSGGGTGTFKVSTLQGGRFGGVAMRDLKPVVNTDWSTYQPGSNTIYFVATTQDASGVQVGPSGGSSFGVFTLNLNTQVITETGVICDSRSSHIYCDDAAGNVIFHANGDREVAESGWGNYVAGSSAALVQYQYITSGSQPDVLTTNLSVLSSMTQLSLPLGTGGIAYDPALAFDAANSRYLMAYTIGSSTGANFYPALATASTQTGTWSSIGSGSTRTDGWEGTSFDNVNGTLYELAGGPRAPFPASLPACSAARIYDETFTYVGNFLGATFINSAAPSAVNCSHPTIFLHPDLQHYVLLTFNGAEYAANAANTGQPMIEISTP